MSDDEFDELWARHGWRELIDSLRQQLAERDAEIAELTAALQAVSDDWDGEHFHNGGDSFMQKVNAALGRGEL